MPTVMHVVPMGDDAWTVTDASMTEDESRTYPTDREAASVARTLLEARGGGELVIHGSDGQVREKELIGVVDTETLSG